MLSPQNQQAAEEILALLEKRPVGFLGAGISNREYNDWGTLIQKLAQRLGQKVDESLDGEIFQAQALYDYDPTGYHSALVEIFGEMPFDCEPALRDIVQCNFKSFLTTNYDWCIQRAFYLTRQPEPDTYSYSDLLETRCHSSSVHHIHGTVNKRNLKSSEFVLHKDSYIEAYSNSREISKFMESVLFHHPMLFVGYSLSTLEPLNGVIDLTLKHLEKAGRSLKEFSEERAILLPGVIDEKEMERFAKLGLRIIRYDPGDNFIEFPKLWRHIELTGRSTINPDGPNVVDTQEDRELPTWASK